MDSGLKSLTYCILVPRVMGKLMILRHSKPHGQLHVRWRASTVVVPAKFIFLVGPISFSGPYCQANIVFQLDGTIIAPTDSKPWGKDILQWLEFTKLKGITVQGKGIIDGRGSVSNFEH
uniref:Uncharacterized protein n=1 Tax=Gossypium raimondii TaxID=29730 RepID=A0A0D2S3W3_GOSRA|nr:hypothetical protein B456_012G159900 [Gossypium raimondii]